MNFAFNDEKKAENGNYFTLPNVMFQLGLSTGELATYAYLLRCEDRKTYQCFPSYKTIGQAIGKTKNAVKTYVDGLRDKGLIKTEPTTKTAKDGTVLNGNLLYTILPIENAIREHNERQNYLSEIESRRQKIRQRAPEYSGTINVG